MVIIDFITDVIEISCLRCCPFVTYFVILISNGHWCLINVILLTKSSLTLGCIWKCCITLFICPSTFFSRRSWLPLDRLISKLLWCFYWRAICLCKCFWLLSDINFLFCGIFFTIWNDRGKYDHQKSCSHCKIYVA